MNEIWKAIDGFEGSYEISNTGKVKALERVVMNNGGMQRKHERILKANYSNGHAMVILCKEGKTYPRFVHRLVACAFIPNPDNKPVVDHIDTDPTNNCVDNLRWVTVKENANNPLSRKHGSESKKGHPYWGRPLTDDERDTIRKALTGKKAGPELRKKLSESHLNSEISLQTSRRNIKKACASNVGKHRSEATKEKIGAKSRGRFKGKKWKIENGKRVWYEPSTDKKE